jgi:integrase
LVQMRKLMYDLEFIQILPERLKRSREMLVIGCLTGLRFSDLLRVRRTDFVQRDGNYYLQNVSKKTQTSVLIKLPHEVMDIVNETNQKGKNLFKKISLVNFNKNVKEVCNLAGWTEIIKSSRTRRGKYEDIKTNSKNPNEVRFCDLVSSHIMRRTAITNLLTLGVSELTVRKISGHSPSSNSFMKYVNLAQSYLDNELEVAHQKLQGKMLQNDRKCIIGSILAVYLIY